MIQDTEILGPLPALDFPVHPAAEIFPMLPDNEIRALAEDIKKNGLLQPLVMFQGQLIDGRNRAVACKLAGVVPSMVECPADIDPSEFVLSTNVRRRSLTANQRALASARALPFFQPGARERMLRGQASPEANLPEGSQATGRSRDLAAKLFLISPRTVGHAAKVLADGIPELVAAVEAGTISVSRGSGIAKLPVEEQRVAIAEGRLRRPLRSSPNSLLPAVEAEWSSDSLPIGEIRGAVQLVRSFVAGQKRSSQDPGAAALARELDELSLEARISGWTLQTDLQPSHAIQMDLAEQPPQVPNVSAVRLPYPVYTPTEPLLPPFIPPLQQRDPTQRVVGCVIRDGKPYYDNRPLVPNSYCVQEDTPEARELEKRVSPQPDPPPPPYPEHWGTPPPGPTTIQSKFGY